MRGGPKRTEWNRRCVPKLCGADIEVGNFILGKEVRSGTGSQAAKALLAEVDGFPDSRRRRRLYSGANRQFPEDPLSSARRRAIAPSPKPEWSSYYQSGYHQSGYYQPVCNQSSYYASSGYQSEVSYDPQDWGRRFLASNGGCVYIDLDHLELCLPEVLSAWDHVAAWHAMMRIARAAAESADAKLPEGQKLQVLANNSDGLGHAFGSHLDFLITREAWDGIFERKLHHMLWLAAYQVSSIVFTGQGKVGAENGHDGVEFQLTQRGDFFETLVGAQTTFRRPVVNSRDEPLCGSRSGVGAQLARLHVIFYDSNLAHGASLLKVGVLQIVLAMIEAECIDPALILDDPLRALHDWGRDPTLAARSRLSSGARVTAVELQTDMLEAARRFVDGGGCEGIVPGAPAILDLWGDTLLKLETGDMVALAGRLDWVLKRSILERALDNNPALDWTSPELKHLDLMYSNLDPEDGLYWAYERAGALESAVSDEQIEHFVRQPPEDTRAWTRAMLLRHAAPGTVHSVDWDEIRFRVPGRGWPPRYVSLDLPDPLGATRRESEVMLDRLAEDDGGGWGEFETLLTALGADVERTARQDDARGHDDHRRSDRGRDNDDESSRKSSEERRHEAAQTIH